MTAQQYLMADCGTLPEQQTIATLHRYNRVKTLCVDKKGDSGWVSCEPFNAMSLRPSRGEDRKLNLSYFRA